MSAPKKPDHLSVAARYQSEAAYTKAVRCHYITDVACNVFKWVGICILVYLSNSLELVKPLIVELSR